MLDAMLLQAGRAALPWILIERADRVRAIAPREHRGRPLEGIELELRPGLVMELYVDPATHRIEWSRGRLAHGGMETVFETVYGDFRRVHGVWFPFREENYASGVHIGYTAFEQVEVNPRLPAGAFGPPRDEWKETEGTSWGGAD